MEVQLLHMHCLRGRVDADIQYLAGYHTIQPNLIVNNLGTTAIVLVVVVLVDRFHSYLWCSYLFQWCLVGLH